MRKTFVTASMIAALFGVLPAVSSARAAQQASQESARRVRVAPTNLKQINIRQQPTTDSAVVSTVRPEEEYAATDVRNGWYFIPAKKGWLAGRYVIVLDASRRVTRARQQPTSPAPSAATVD